MSFPEYLKERISEDYKNLIIQKLEEIKKQTENLSASMNPSVEDAHTALREAVRDEFNRIEGTINTQVVQAQQKISEQMNQLVNDYMSAWYHSDVTPFQQQLEMLISDIVSNVPLPPKKESSDINSLVDLFRKLDEAVTQSEVLNLVLQHVSEWVQRAVLFIVKGDQAVAWSALGLGSGWDPNRIRQIKVGLNENHMLREVVTLGAMVSGAADHFPDNSQVFFQIGDTFPQSFVAAPVLVRGKIAGILYTDMAEDLAEKPDLPNLVYLAAHASGSAIDMLAIKPAGVRPPVAPRPAARPAAPVTPVTPAPARASQVAEESPAATVMMPPPPAAPVLTEEEQKLHEDAKRFARLLVSEIKLYNEAQVSAGREHKDLYDRLRDDIERSRRMYQERVAQQIQANTDYFYEELVKTLANGDPSLLGM